MTGAFPLDLESPVPRYAQLAALIASRISEGSLPPGSRLPAERDLCAAAGISRMTARQAIAQLARQGLVEIQHGVGTCVAGPKWTYDALQPLGFSEATFRQGGDVTTRTLEQSVVAAPGLAAEALRLPVGAPVVKLVRVRSAGGVPVLLQTSYLPADRCPGLAGEDLEHGSLYAILDARHGIRITGVSQVIEAAVANAWRAAQLGVPRGAPLLVMDGVASDADGRPIEAFRAVYRGDRARITLDTSAAADPAAAPQLAVLVT
ncbi:MAG: GntR family transcriptional regulator [Chloroflexota bacterium]